MGSMLDAIDDARLTPRYWSMATAVALGAMLEFFDFFLIGFVVSIVARPWHLTFGQGAVILLSAGIGAIAGSFLWGWLGDHYGRKPALIAGILTFSLGTGVMILTPPGAWVFLSAFRFVVGAGVGGLATVANPLVVEFTPTRLRTSLSGFIASGLVPLGTLLAAALAAAVAPSVGWRGLFAIGLAPALLAIWVAVSVPESPRWLLSRGRAAEARRAVAWMLNVPEGSLPLAAPSTPSPERAGYAQLYRYRRSFWITVLAWFGATTAVYGINLWGPTILTLLLKTPPSRAAFLFVFVSLGGFVGRILFSLVLPQRIGRRACGWLMGLGAAVLLAVAGLAHSVFVGGVSFFWLALIASLVFADGGFANLAPYSPEIFPAHLRAHGMGLAEVANGVGKIFGPMGLAIIAGSGNLVAPQATLDAILPGFLFLSAASLLVMVSFLAIPVESRGRTLEGIEADLAGGRGVPAP
jgi:putative MFS transporter